MHCSSGEGKMKTEGTEAGILRNELNSGNYPVYWNGNYRENVQGFIGENKMLTNLDVSVHQTRHAC